MRASGKGARVECQGEWEPVARWLGRNGDQRLGMGSPQVSTSQVHKWVWLHAPALPTSQVSDDPSTKAER